MKNIIKSAMTLLIICAVAVAAMAYVHAITLEPIKVQEIETEKTAMEKVLPFADDFPQAMVKTEDPSFVDYGILKIAVGMKNNEPVGIIVTTLTKGFGGELKIITGVNLDGSVSGIYVLKHSETPGLGALCTTEEVQNSFVGKIPPLQVVKKETNSANEISAITGATITSNAISESVNNAVAWVEAYGGELN